MVDTIVVLPYSGPYFGYAYKYYPTSTYVPVSAPADADGKPNYIFRFFLFCEKELK